MNIIGVNGPSAGKLAHILNCCVFHPNGQDYDWDKFGRDTDRPTKLPRQINYGCKKKHLLADAINFNSQDACEKVKTFEIFEQNNIPHPRLIDPNEYYGDYLTRIDKKSKGQGIVFRKLGSPTKRYQEKHDFAVEFIKSIAEYRVHVWQGNILLEMNKCFGEHEFIQSSVYGAKLKAGYIDHPKRLKILDDAAKSIHLCGLDYGAVDILVGSDGQHRILECNSAPSMSGIIGYIYAEYINHRFNLGLTFSWTTKNGRVERQTRVGKKIIDNGRARY